MSAFTAEDRDFDTMQPGDNFASKMFRAIFASVDLCLIESGCPLTDEQRTVMRKALDQNNASP